jgi:hypothetical protein
MEMGKKIMADQTGKFFAGKGASGGAEEFYNGIRALIEDVYGMGNQLSGKFEAVEGYDPDVVKEGMAVLGDLRNMVEYSGEFSS